MTLTPFLLEAWFHRVALTKKLQRGINMNTLVTRMAIATIAFFLVGPVQAEEEMLVPGYGAGQDLPGAYLAPDANTEYKHAVLNDLPP